MRHPITESGSIQYQQGDPRSCCELWQQSAWVGDRMLVVDFEFTAYWLESQPGQSLSAIYLQRGGELRVSVTDRPLVQARLSAAEQYEQWAEELGLAQYIFGRPASFDSLAIVKPWGQEIWYTGVEARGVCCVNAGGGSVPIPWLQAAVPGNSLGQPGEPLVLLKILDPVPEAVTGDLYFELHEEKREVYVVTHVDETAWPDGQGYIRMGFNEEKLALFNGDGDAFRQGYLQSVREYESVRREIDDLPEGSTPDEQLVSAEIERRNRMDEFSHLRPLRVGDVVKVPLLTPHSLQHGVRTVEFQTPVYERKILSFAQKVLTQSHWDTESAVAQMQLHPAPAEAFETLLQTDGVLVERIVDFADFEVRRVRLSGSGVLEIAPLQAYGVIMVVEGNLAVSGEDYGPEQALILPLAWQGGLTSRQGACPVVFLLALPRN
ncbi:MAG: hypothetical protein V7754_09420 [Halioglobus sp.]